MSPGHHAARVEHLGQHSQHDCKSTNPRHKKSEPDHRWREGAAHTSSITVFDPRLQYLTTVVCTRRWRGSGSTSGRLAADWGVRGGAAEGSMCARARVCVCVAGGGRGGLLFLAVTSPPICSGGFGSSSGRMGSGESRAKRHCLLQKSISPPVPPSLPAMHPDFAMITAAMGREPPSERGEGYHDGADYSQAA